jgi:ssDNA thymidine ADP-ribosyltransferase, DarT
MCVFTQHVHLRTKNRHIQTIVRLRSVSKLSRRAVIEELKVAEVERPGIVAAEMNARVTEFHCIMPIENIPSVLARGILCHENAAKLYHKSVALRNVQDVRGQKQVPGGLKLHQYANLYFHARIR